MSWNASASELVFLSNFRDKQEFCDLTEHGTEDNLPYCDVYLLTKSNTEKNVV